MKHPTASATDSTPHSSPSSLTPSSAPRASSPSTSLTINNGSNVNSSAITTAGDVAYISNDIRVQASDIESYAVQISYASGSNSLSLADGSVVLSGANNTTPTNMSPNTWGYSWSSTNTNPESTTYQTLSTTNTRLSGDSVSNNSIDFTRRLTFAAKFGEGVKAGHYSTSVLLSLTATPKVVVNYSINYNCNGGSGCPSNFSTESSNTSYNYTIPNTTPIKTGYKFLGYNTSNSTTADSSYAPGKVIALTSNSKSRTLYAVWELNPTLKNMTTMQQMTTQACTDSKIGDITTLKDTRDNNTYTVRKHEDGNCWMTQNLRLVGPITLTPTDSNVKSNYTLPGSNIDGFSSSSYHMSQVYYAGNTTHGAYYSFMAATAGTGNSSLINGDASGSICPKGWKLPSNYGNGSYNNFLDKTDIANSATGSARLRSDPYNFPYTGFVTNGRLFNIDSSGNHWSRTASSADHTRNLYFDNNRINPSANNGRYYGYSIRCVALGN